MPLSDTLFGSSQLLKKAKFWRFTHPYYL